MKGYGEAGGALSVVNAIACGFGAAFGISLSTKATAELSEDDEFSLSINGRESSTVLVKELFRELVPLLPEECRGVHVETVSDIPPSVGLKSSSAASNAILLAMIHAADVAISPIDLIRMGCRASIKAGVSITGAFDDACSSLFGGLVLTDNTRMEILQERPMPENYEAVICIPEDSQRQFSADRFRMHADEMQRIFQTAESGDIFSAMYENGRIVGSVSGIGTEIADAAIRAGAVTAGISGAGPAVGILVQKDNLDSIFSAFSEWNCFHCSIRNKGVI